MCYIHFHHQTPRKCSRINQPLASYIPQELSSVTKFSTNTRQTFSPDHLLKVELANQKYTCNEE
uniref:Uncharacterized protein n=1 Tax=Rhizophora mucronata TaxID=61149 RepID=A0A2P2N6J2_RHIMU